MTEREVVVLCCAVFWFLAGEVQLGSVNLNLREDWWGEQWRWHAVWWKSSLQRCVEGVRGRQGRRPPSTLESKGVEAAMRVETRPWPPGITEVRPTATTSSSSNGSILLLRVWWSALHREMKLLTPTTP